MNKIRIDAITGLRGFAALLVIYSHLAEKGFVPLDPRFPGEIGVMIFFSLSGFLMAFLYMGKPFSPQAAADYAISRFARIAPAYLFIVLVSFVIYTQIDDNFIYALSVKNILRHIFFSGNVSVFWSITPEVEFYVLFVVIWAVSSRFSTRAGMAGIILLAFFCMFLLAYRDRFPGTFVGSKLHYFLFGVVAGVVRAKIKITEPDNKSFSVLHLLVVALMVLVEMNVIEFPFPTRKEFYSSLLTAVFSSFLVFVFSFPSMVGKAVFENKVMLFCGECSFSIYLLHMPIIYIFKKLLPVPYPVWFLIAPIVLISLVVSWTNFKIVEKNGARLIKSIGTRLAQRLFSRVSLNENGNSLSLKGNLEKI